MKKLFLSLSLICGLAAISTATFATSLLSSKVSALQNEDRDVKNFNGVAAGGPLTVIVTLGSTEGIRFEGDAEAISTLITEVKGTTLIIRPENSWTSWERKYKGKKIVAYVSAKMIKSLVMSGNGSLSVKGNIRGASLTSTLSGSGHIDANMDVDNFTGVISGSGNLNVSGKADHASITISGSGNLPKKGLSVGSLQTVISGSGSVNVNADDSLNAVISGSGNVNYTGNASVEKKVFGSGSVRKM